eukprot:CAMPEP_0184654942 /NCGR_PEP_ID=MMETSP0308-20130426/12597_1 /TAXON_ID=38269 /ORGANISM="Gloeochaete witrockiana, Strain SAG 46.84" /LENGTH=85 /DNA_ID=CAMNT_0027091161 /DNA_START=1094 /DNA_END=1351 /DNA_ORIENTATION=+
MGAIEVAKSIIIREKLPFNSNSSEMLLSIAKRAEPWELRVIEARAGEDAILRYMKGECIKLLYGSTAYHRELVDLVSADQLGELY